MLTISNMEFERLCQYIKRYYGINLYNKRNIIEGRLSGYILERGYKGFGEYLEKVFNDHTGKEISFLVEKLTTNHTYFMREWEHFEYYKNKVLPYFSNILKERDLRVWSAGCSSGEEPYTLAMINKDYFKGKGGAWDTKILATDISDKVIAQGVKGVYTEENIKDLKPEWKREYLNNVGNGNYAISDEIKKEVIFRSFNLMEQNFPFKKKFHVIFCRNVMIYFDTSTKVKLINKFYESTEVGGYLFIGHSESLAYHNTNYKYIMPAVYRKE
ncbi:CheR family methyltransferase [Clostridium cylindrosporum]|nr:protein-glutamate O-methyltransferase CheR [Clostridium cylindrosporum]